METVMTKYNYDEYIKLTEEIVNNNIITENETNIKMYATKLNLLRMQRIYKSTRILPYYSDLISSGNNPVYITAIAEPWCGDGAQIIPVVAKLIQASNKISMELVLRDENPELINEFKTNGTLSIPKFIFRNEAGQLLGTWGPRPKAIANMVVELKTKRPNIPHEEFVIEVQKFYNNDRQQGIISEVSNLLIKMMA